MIDDERYRVVIERSAKNIRDIANRVPVKYWPELFEAVGIEQAMEAAGKIEIDKTLEEADDIDMEMLSKLSLRAMKQGMTGPNPNAQVIRVFHAWQAEQEGLKQLRSVDITIVPGEVNDKMSDELCSILRELTTLANS